MVNDGFLWCATVTKDTYKTVSEGRNETNLGTKAECTMAGVAIGGTVMMEAWVGGPVMGASVNSARSLALALFAGRLDSLWIYILGPCAEAVLAALLYEGIHLTPSNGKNHKE